MKKILIFIYLLAFSLNTFAGAKKDLKYDETTGEVVPSTANLDLNPSGEVRVKGTKSNAFTDTNQTDIGLNNTHRGDITGNPHAVTKTQVGLGNVTDDEQVKKTDGITVDLNKLNLKDASELTISTGAVTVTQVIHTVDGEGDLDDDLVTISGGTAEDVLYLRPADPARNITLVNSTGNIITPNGANYLIPDNAIIQLVYDGSNWRVIGYVLTGAGTGDVIGPASSTANAIVRFDGTTGKAVKNSNVTIDDNGSVNIPSGEKYKINGVDLAATDVGAEPTITTLSHEKGGLEADVSAYAGLVKITGGATSQQDIGDDSGDVPTRPANNALSADSISEITGNNGVDVDTLKLKDGSVVDLKSMQLNASSELTISSGAITAVQSYHSVDGEGDLDDDLATINGTANVNFLVLYPENAGRNITLVHGTGNIVTADGQDFLIKDDGLVILAYDGSSWRLVGGAGGSAASDTTWTGANWTSTEQAPTQRAAEEALKEVGVRFTDKTSGLGETDNGKLVQAYYHSTGSIDANTLILVHADSDYSDSTTYNRTPTNTGASINTTTKKFGAGSVYIDGLSTSDRVTYPNSSDWDDLDDTYTLECWIYLPTVAPFNIMGRSETSSPYAGWYIAVTGTGAVDIVYGNNNSMLTSPASVITASTWHHVAISSNGTTAKMFIDGVEKDSTTANITLQDYSTTFCVGNRSDGAGGANDAGYIDEVRISNTARYTTGFTPEGPFPIGVVTQDYRKSENARLLSGISTDGATLTEIANVAVPEGRVVYVEAQITGRKTDGTDRAVYKIAGCFYRNTAGNVTQQGATQDIITPIESNASWATTLSADTGNQTIDINVQGVAATDIDWKTEYKWQYVE